MTNEYGRPEIQEPRRARWLSFNLSHTRGLIVCIVARERAVGIDVEARDRGGRLLEVADRFFSPDEVQALRSLPEEEQLERFFVYWTLKESYIKARGMGLAIPLSEFSFDVASGIRIHFDPRLRDDPERWQFTSLSHGRRHALAVSVERTRHEWVSLSVEDYVPLVGGGSGPGRISRR